MNRVLIIMFSLIAEECVVHRMNLNITLVLQKIISAKDVFPCPHVNFYFMYYCVADWPFQIVCCKMLLLRIVGVKTGSFLAFI